MSLYMSASRDCPAPKKQDNLSESFKGKGQWPVAQRRQFMVLGAGVTAFYMAVNFGANCLETTHFSGLVGDQVEQLKETVMAAGETAGTVTIGVAAVAACVSLATKAVRYLRDRHAANMYPTPLPAVQPPVRIGLGEELLRVGLGRPEPAFVTA